MQGGKNWILPKDMNAGSSLAGNLVNPLISLYGTEWRDRGYGLRPSDGTPNAATVAVTTGRVSLSPCTALWSMKIKNNSFGIQ